MNDNNIRNARQHGSKSAVTSYVMNHEGGLLDPTPFLGEPATLPNGMQDKFSTGFGVRDRDASERSFHNPLDHFLQETSTGAPFFP
jgi:hypothetical protein